MSQEFIGALALLVIAVPIVGGAVAWRVRPNRSGRVAATAIAVSSTAAVALAVPAIGGDPLMALGGVIVVDALSGLIVVVVAAVGCIAAAGTPGYLASAMADGHIDARDAGRLWALMAWFVGGLLAVPLLDNLGLIWVAIEAVTVVSALLVGITGTPAAIEAAWKYLILGSVGVGFALLGTLLAYASSVAVLGETSDALAWTRLLAVARHLDPGLIRLAYVFALVGYGTKAGLAPFHTWLPDAHSQAPSPVSAVLSGATLAIALYALARFTQVVQVTLGPAFPSALLIGFGLLSIAVAAPFIVAQGDLKRLLAYSSIEHTGIIALALGFGGPLALSALALHLVVHGLIKASLFLSAGGLVESGGSRRIARLAGGLVFNPANGRAFLGGAVLLSGLPPSALFVTEVGIIIGGFQRGWGLAAGLAAVLIAAAAAGFLFHVGRVAFGQPRRAIVVHAIGGRPGRVGGLLALGAPLVLAALLGVWSPPQLESALLHVVQVLGAGGG